MDVLTNPTRKVKSPAPIIIAAGWRPGCSTDMDAVLLAKTHGAKEIINLSNISSVYDKDPKTHANAKKISSIDWEHFRREIVGNDWHPGINAPFDPIASRAAEKLGVTVSILDGTNLKQVRNVLHGRTFEGTTIHP